MRHLGSALDREWRHQSRAMELWSEKFLQFENQIQVESPRNLNLSGGFPLSCHLMRGETSSQNLKESSQFLSKLLRLPWPGWLRPYTDISEWSCSTKLKGASWDASWAPPRWGVSGMSSWERALECPGSTLEWSLLVWERFEESIDSHDSHDSSRFRVQWIN